LNINSEVVIKNDMLQVYTWRRFPFFSLFYDSIWFNHFKSTPLRQRNQTIFAW
jgi:hypothetical protein